MGQGLKVYRFRVQGVNGFKVQGTQNQKVQDNRENLNGKGELAREYF